jgi:hypothetical protein
MVFADSELRVRRTNAAFRQLTGLPDEALIGRRPSEIGAADHSVDTDLAAPVVVLEALVVSTAVTAVGVHAPPDLALPRCGASFPATGSGWSPSVAGTGSWPAAEPRGRAARRCRQRPGRVARRARHPRLAAGQASPARRPAHAP